VTGPFQSIIDTPHNSLGNQAERNKPPLGSAAAKKVPGLTALPPQQRKPLRGGVYTPADALKLINSHFFVGKNNQETAIFRINDDGSLAFMPAEQFKLDLANIFVQPSGRANPIPAEKYWKESPHRHQWQAEGLLAGSANRQSGEVFLTVNKVLRVCFFGPTKF
jgi:hypothetical protein